MFLRAFLFPLSFLFCVVVAPVDARDAGLAAAPLRAWDGIISDVLFADIADFKLDIREEKGERVYAFLALDRTGEVTLSVVATITPGGSRLPAADWQRAIAAADPATKARNFPEIGARARTEAPRFSSEVALSDVTFVTGDGFFDVVVSVYERSGKADRPPLTALDAARRINAAYDVTRE